MITIQKMRNLCNALVDVCQESLNQGICPVCGKSVTDDLVAQLDIYHDENCQYVMAKAWLATDKAERMKKLVDMIEKDLNIKCVIEKGNIVDCVM